MKLPSNAPMFVGKANFQVQHIFSNFSHFFPNSFKIGAEIHYLYVFIASNNTHKLSTKCGCRDQHKYLTKDDIISMLLDGTHNHFKMLESYCEDCKLLEQYPDKPKDKCAHFCPKYV